MVKVLYIAPHLSTGGAPQFLLKRIQLLKDDCDIYCVEYSDITGGQLVVQKDQIKNILGDKLITLGDDKFELIEIIKKIKPEIVHFEEMPEYFCDIAVAKKIYTKNRKYKILETSHDSSFEPDNKMFFPDKFTFVSEYQKRRLSSIGVPAEVVEYPIEIKKKTDRTKALENLGLDPDVTHILNVGLFTPRKNQAEIIEYARKLADQPVHFHFVGNQAGNFEYYWKPIMDNFPSNCTWWNERKDTDTFYNAMDVFLFTSKGTSYDKETSPLVLKEAIGWGMPVLMRRLEVYCGMHDKYDNVKYITDDLENNLSILKSYINKNEKKETFSISCAKEENKYFITLLDFNKTGRYRIVAKDPVNNLVYNIGYENDFVFPKADHGIWLSPNFDLNETNGCVIEIYDENLKLIQSKEFINKDYKDSWSPLTFPETHISVGDKIIDFKCNPFDHSSSWTFKEVFLCEDYKNIQPNDVVVDIGANLGLFSLYAMKMGAKCVHAIEPIKETFDYLKHNTKDIDNIRLYNCGLGAKNKKTKFLSGSVSSISGSDIKNLENGHEWHQKKLSMAQIFNVNDFLSKNDIKYIDYLKIDCEGAEYDILNSLDESYLRNNVKRIVGELHGDYLTEVKVNKILNKLKKLNFKVTTQSNDYNSLVIFEAIKIPKIKIVHLLNNVNGDRELVSIESLKKLERFGFDYEQLVTPLYKDLPPKENCWRVECISDKPGDYLLTPAHYGCYLAHKSAICKKYDEIYDAVLICECDAKIFGELNETVEKIYDAFYKTIKYDVVYTSFGKKVENHPHLKLQDDFSQTDCQSEAHTYLVTAHHLPKLKNKIENTLWDVFDIWGNNMLHLPRGIFDEPYFVQQEGFSTLDLNFKQGNNLSASLQKIVYDPNKIDEDITVVVQSCDDYEKFWEGWYMSFERYWNWDLNWPILFCTETKKPDFNNKNISTLTNPEQKGKNKFSSRLIDILENVKTKYVLYLQEDMWPILPVNFTVFKKSLNKIRKNDWNCIRLHEKIWFDYKLQKTNQFIKNKRILKVLNHSDWLMTHNAAIWNKDFLLKNSELNQDPWEHEIEGTLNISRNIDPKIYHLNERWYYQPGASQNGEFNGYMQEYLRDLKLAKELEDTFDL